MVVKGSFFDAKLTLPLSRCKIWVHPWEQKAVFHTKLAQYAKFGEVHFPPKFCTFNRNFTPPKFCALKVNFQSMFLPKVFSASKCALCSQMLHLDSVCIKICILFPKLHLVPKVHFPSKVFHLPLKFCTLLLHQNFAPYTSTKILTWKRKKKKKYIFTFFYPFLPPFTIFQGMSAHKSTGQKNNNNKTKKNNNTK